MPGDINCMIMVMCVRVGKMSKLISKVACAMCMIMVMCVRVVKMSKLVSKVACAR